MDINDFANDPRVVKSEKIVNVNLQKDVIEKRQQLAPEGFDQEKASKLRGENVGGGRTKFVPESLGFHDAPKEEHVDDVTKALEKFDNEILPAKQEEARKFAETIEAAGSVTEREWNEMNGVGYVNDVIDEPKRVNAMKTWDSSEEETKERYEAEQQHWKQVDEARKNEYEPKNDNFGLDLDNLDLPYDESEVESMDNNIFDDEETKEDAMDEMVQATEITTPHLTHHNVVLDEVQEDIEENIKPERETKSYTMVPNDESPKIKPKDTVEVENTTPININMDEKSTKDIKTLVDNKVEIPESNIIESYDDDIEKELMEDDLEVEDSLDPTKETDEQIQERFKKSVIEKIKPVTKAFDISTFSVANKKIPFSNATKAATTHFRSAKWALMSSGRPITMRSFKSTELDALSTNDQSLNRYMNAKKMYGIIFEHIMDPKPKTVEDWAKVNSFLDLDHIWFAIYRACFEGSNYIPTDCIDTEKCRNVFLSDNTPIKDCIKFKDDNAKKKFNKIINSESNVTSLMYTSEITPVSDDYAIAFREPSIYNIVFESALLDEAFVSKHRDLVSIIAYIDKIYRINHETQTLEEIDLPYFADNAGKTFKTKVVNYAKIINTLNSDQYRFILTIIDHINKRGDELTYIYPEMTCPKCGSTVPERPVNAQQMVFLRHQLVALAI